MKNILLPTDFSANSMNAIDYAMRFFEHWECTFHILNVQKVSEYTTGDLLTATPTDSIYEGISVDNKKLIHQLVENLSKQYKSQAYIFNGLFDYDDFISSIKQAVHFHSIELIIMGSNGATGAEEHLFGSNTLQVIRSVECPTLTIPEHYTFSDIKSALFSTQRCEDFSFEGIKAFKEMLIIHQCELKVLELDDDASIMTCKTDNNCIKALFPDHPYTYYYLNTIPGLVAVNTATQLLRVDLHAAFIEKETFLGRLLFGSDNSALLYRTQIPLLFLHR
jgi:nucleotide-binding universal stress UspA family protein